MNKWTKTAGLIFMAAASVYSDRANAAKPGRAAASPDKSAATDVKLLEESDPFATVAPTTAPTAVEGESVKVSAAPMHLNADGTFSLNITAGADIVEQLRVIGFQAQSSIIPSKDVRGSLPAMDLYNVTVHEALDALLHANGYAWREKGKFIYVYSAKEIAQMEQANRVMNTEVFRLFYTPASNVVTMIKPVLSADAQVSSTTPAKGGLATGTSDLGGNDHAAEDIIIVTDYPENLDKVRQVLKEIDRRPEQILIEATIMRASLNEDNKLGVDFNILGGVDFSSLTTTGGQITNSAISDGSGSIDGAGRVHSVGTGNAFSGPITGGLKVGVVSQNISVFLSALEGVTDTTIMANPKVLALNKHKGEVIVGREDGYITTTFTETQSSQTVEFLKTGTRLIFRPFIADDGYIRMEVHPEDSSGGLQTAANLPFKVTTEVTSNIMVKDGHTVVIGGLFRESSDSTRSQIPVLGDLPLAGPLFRSQADATRREEVIILLTPHIIKDDSVYSELSKQQLKDAEKLRVGVRKGMQFWGRERLADMNYECAVAELAKPRPDRKKAIWHLNAATNLNPKFIEAINLKQELTGKEISTTDGSTVRSFVKRAILVDNKRPATQPIVDATEEATTQPVAETTAPATQPAVAEAPATQPAVAEAVTPATQPTVAEVEATEAQTEVVAGADESTPDADTLIAPVTEITEITELPAEAETAAVPTTAPVAVESEQNGENATDWTVTEILTDEIPGAGLDASK